MQRISDVTIFLTFHLKRNENIVIFKSSMPRSKTRLENKIGQYYRVRCEIVSIQQGYILICKVTHKLPRQPILMVYYLLKISR